MFLYWDGFEIDGSDTAFNIILPEDVQLRDFVECFLAIPLFSYRDEPVCRQHKECLCCNDEMTLDELLRRITAGDERDFTIVSECLPPDLLSPEVFTEVRALSAGRAPLEDAYGQTEHPVAAPEFSSELTVEFGLSLRNRWIDAETSPEDVEGYCRNVELFFEQEKSLLHLSLHCGPSFFYEYAVYIIEYLRERFPGIGTCGGLDCAGGWTNGCTYADSLYRYECFDFPVLHSVRNTLKRFAEYGLLHSYDSKNLECTPISKLRFANPEQNPDWPGVFVRKALYKAGILRPDLAEFGDYAGLVEKTLESDLPSAEMTFLTAVHILLPKPEFFSDSPEVEEKLQALMIDSRYDWERRAFLCFRREEEKRICEYRVPWKMKPYFALLLELAESGEIDFIKTVEYERRKNS